jgi:hypothetical protein
MSKTNKGKKQNNSKSKVFVANPFRWDDDDTYEPVIEVKSAVASKKTPGLQVMKNKSDVRSRQLPK